MAEPGVLVGLYDLVLWYTQRTERFPKSLRVTLGDRIDCKLLDMLELAVRARYAREPRRILQSLNTELDLLRYLTRLAKDRGALEAKQYEFVSRCVEDIGRQVGGWLKSEKRVENTQEPVSASLGF